MGSWRLLTRGRRRMRRKRRERAIPFAPVAPRGVNIWILFEGALVTGSTDGPGNRSDISSHVGVESAVIGVAARVFLRPSKESEDRFSSRSRRIERRRVGPADFRRRKRCCIFPSGGIARDGIPMTRSADSCVRSEVSERLVNRYTTTESMLHS